MKTATQLRLQKRRSNDPSFDPLAERRPLEAEGQWVLEGPSETLQDIAAALGRLADQVGNALLISFGNSVGYYDLPHLGRVEVLSGKWTKRDFDAMLGELTTVASRLPYAAGGSSALPYDRSVVTRRPVLYHLFTYLRHVLDDDAPRKDALMPALETILRDPHRQLLKRRVRSRAELARSLDAKSLELMITGQARLRRVHGSAALGAAAVALRGHLPEEVDEPQTFNTFDTSENRFVKCFLDFALAVIKELETLAETAGKPPFSARLATDCACLRRRLEPVRRRALWHDVGRMTHFPAGSTVLHRRRGYREVFRCFVRLRLAARMPLESELVERLLEVRDIAELYELWCYFKLVDLTAAILGPPLRAAGREVEHDDWGAKVKWDFSVRWSNGVTLYYNRSFSRSASRPRHSWSVPLRPDVTLEISDGPSAGLHIFDAKFKLERETRLSCANGDDQKADSQEAEERRRRWQQADLYKMHTYRDAIEAARSARTLYPGSESSFFRPRQRDAHEGVGATPLSPDVTNHAFEQLEFLLRSGERPGVPPGSG